MGSMQPLVSKSLVTATGASVARSLEDRFADVINVKDFGVVGDGVAIDTTAFQNALDATQSGNRTVRVPKGTYKVRDLRVNYPCRIIGDPGAVLTTTNEDRVSASTNRYITVLSNDVIIEGLTFQGEENVANLSPTYPTTCLYVSADADDTPRKRVVIRNCLIYGGVNSFTVQNCEDFVYENNHTRGASSWNATFGSLRNAWITNNRSSAGKMEGMKFGNVDPARAENLYISGNIIFDNGASGKEGIDMFIRSASRLVVSNNILYNNTGGGIEIKKDVYTGGSSDTYDDLIVSDNIINVVGDNPGITSHFHDTLDTSNGMRRYVFSGNLIRHTGNVKTATSGAGINLDGTNGALVANNLFHDCSVGVSLQGASSTGQNTDITITGNRMISVGIGVRFHADASVNTTIKDNTVNCLDWGVYCASTASATGAYIVENTIVQSGGTQGTRAGISLIRVSNTHIARNTITAELIGLYVPSGGTSAPDNLSIHENYSTATNNAIRLEAGANHQIWNNTIVCSAESLRIGAGATTGTMAWNNVRGASASAPTLRATVGDIVYNSTPTAGGNIGWVCTTSGNPGTWKAFGTIAA